MPILEITVDWPERAELRGWRISKVIAVDENDVPITLQIIKATMPVALKKRKK